MSRVTRERYVPAAVFAVLGAAVLVGLILNATGSELGTPVPPLIGQPEFGVHWLIAPAVALFAGAVWVAPRLLTLSTPWFLAAATAGTLVLRLALQAGGDGPGEWDRIFDPDGSFEGPNEYLPALIALRYGPDIFLDRFAEVVPALPVHAAGHPPGLLLTMDFLGIASSQGLAALCIFAGALATPLVYLVGRELLDEPRARVAALALVFSPVALLFGATSADGLFMTLGLLAAWPLATWRTTGTWGRLAGGAAALALVSFFAWSLLAIPAWAAVIAWRRDGFRRALTLGAACAAAIAVFYTALFALTGFDPIGTFQATEGVYRAGIASTRPYTYWFFGSPAAFLFTLGVPLTWLALRALGRGEDVAVAIFAVIAVACIAGFTKAETERIWLFFAPFVCLAAAAVLPVERVRPVFGALAVQALVTEVVWFTVW